MPIEFMGIQMSDATATTVGGGAAVVFAGIVARFLTALFSRGKRDFVSDRSEDSQIARLEAEVKRQTERADRETARADLAFTERNQAIERAAVAIGRVDGLEREVAELRAEIARMRALLEGFYTIKGDD